MSTICSAITVEIKTHPDFAVVVAIPTGMVAKKQSIFGGRYGMLLYRTNYSALGRTDAEDLLTLLFLAYNLTSRATYRITAIIDAPVLLLGAEGRRVRLGDRGGVGSVRCAVHAGRAF